MMKSRIHIFKQHLRQAKTVGWDLKTILSAIVKTCEIGAHNPDRVFLCPFDCLHCPHDEKCKDNYITKGTIWRKCFVFPHKLKWYKTGAVKKTCWARQEKWYQEVEDREALQKITMEVWDEQE